MPALRQATQAAEASFPYRILPAQSYPVERVTKTDDLSNLIGDLQRQRRQLDADLDDTARSQKSTAQIVEKIIEIKQRAEEIRQRTADPADHT